MTTGPIECAAVGCTAVRRTVNFWYVVTSDERGAHIYKWELCPPKAMRTGKHFCGLNHAFAYASNVLTPDTTRADRESTHELKPLPLEGPAARQDEVSIDPTDS
jgi:hypothetical protein